MKHLTLVALLVALAAVPFALAEDDPAAPATPEVTGKPAVMAALEKANAAAKAEDWDAMISACHKAIDEAQKIQLGSLDVVFPDAPAGWTAGKVESHRHSAGAGGESLSGVHLVRKYREEAEGGATIEVTLSNWSMLRNQYKHWLDQKDQMPEMLKMMGITMFEKNGYQCMKMEQPDSKQVTLMGFGAKRMLMLSCNQKKMAAVETIFNLIPLEKALGEK